MTTYKERDGHMNIIEKTDHSNRSRPIKVLIGDCGENIGTMICDWLSKTSDGNLTIKTAITLQSNVLVEFVQNGDFDLALLVLNNMIFNPHEPDVRKRIESGMGLVSELRHKYDLPVIALYGAPRDSSLAKQIMENGAEFASLIPCESKNIESAFYKCILPVPYESN